MNIFINLCLDRYTGIFVVRYDKACLTKDFCSGLSLAGNWMENSITKSPLILWSLCDTIPSPLILFVCPGLHG